MRFDIDFMIEHVTGRRVDHTPENKERRQGFAVAPRSLVDVRPKYINWRNWRPNRMHLWQDCNGCTGWALVNILNHDPYRSILKRRHRDAGKRTYLPTLGDEDGRVRYIRATEEDRWEGTYDPATGAFDNGSSGGAAAQGAREDGMISGNRWIFNEEQFWAAFSEGPIYTGTAWDRSMFEPDDEGYIKPDGNDLNMGHQYVIDSYHPAYDEFGIDNSWGPRWGKWGSARIKREHYFDLLFNRQGDAQLLIP